MAAALPVLAIGCSAVQADDLDFSDSPAASDTENTMITTVRNYFGLQECQLYGQKFWLVPNSNTCLRFHFQATGDLFARTPEQPTDTIARPQLLVGVETRTATQYGTFRTFVSGRLVHDFTSSGAAPAASPFEIDNANQQRQSGLDKAFFEYFGFMAGRNNSFFDFENGYTITGGRVSLRRTNLIGYSAHFTDAWRATISVEDNADRQTFLLGNPLPGYSSNRTPDIVGTIRHLTPNTNIQGSIASHVVDALDPTISQKTGFGAQVGAVVFLPYFGDPLADRVSVSTAYAEGASSYLGFTTNVPDAVGLSSNLFLTRGWNVAGSYMHFWSERWSSAFTVGYASARTGLALPNFSSFDEFRTLANLVWTPAPDWQLAIEYLHVEQRSNFVTASRATIERGQFRVRYEY